MSCEKRTARVGGDSLEIEGSHRPFDSSAAAWLIGQGVRYVNTADKEGELAYTRVIELLRSCSKGVLEAMVGMFRQIGAGDAPLRWNLLYVLGDSGDESAADFLVQAALKQLPEAREGEGCESSRDTEMLVCTMAVHALHRVAQRHPEVSEQLLKVISARPARPILIETVKVAGELGLKDKVRDLLPKEDHWIMDIRRVRTEELFAEPEREEGKERGFTPPKTGAGYTAPQAACCPRKDK